MTTQERSIIARKWMAIGAMHGKVFPKDAWTIMLDSLVDLPYQRIINALDGWLTGPKARQFPFPIDLRDMVIPPVDDETVSREAASRVIAAVTKFGYPNPTEAREYIGELGWIAVVRAGGWIYICENLGKSDMPNGVFQAQVRDICAAQIKLSKAGILDQPIALPTPSNQPSLGESSTFLKELDARRAMTTK